jgi:hypothetical protein
MHVIGCGKGIESPSCPCACLPIMTKTQSSPSDFTQEHHPYDLRLTTNLSLCRYSFRFTIIYAHDSNHVFPSRHNVHFDDHVPIRRWRCPSSSMQPMSASCFPHITACSPLLFTTNSADRYCLPPLHTGPHALAAQCWCTRDFYCWPPSAPIYLVTPVKAISCSRSTYQHPRARSSKVFACEYVISSNHICYHKAPKKEQAASPQGRHFAITIRCVTLARATRATGGQAGPCRRT